VCAEGAGERAGKFAVISVSSGCFVGTKHAISVQEEVRSFSRRLWNSSAPSSKAQCSVHHTEEAEIRTSIFALPLKSALVCSQGLVPKLPPLSPLPREVVTFAEVDFARRHLLHIESRHQKLPYEIGFFTVSLFITLPEPSIEESTRKCSGFCIRKGGVFLKNAYLKKSFMCPVWSLR
jgi:hypothetical protein